MTDTNLYEWYALLPPDILRRAYRASHGELAWARSDALEIVDILQGQGTTILGIDIWLPTHPGPTIPTPFVYDWDERYPVSAIDFIRTFVWDETDGSHRGLAPYFAITA